MSSENRGSTATSLGMRIILNEAVGSFRCRKERARNGKLLEMRSWIARVQEINNARTLMDISSRRKCVIGAFHLSCLRLPAVCVVHVLVEQSQQARKCGHPQAFPRRRTDQCQQTRKTQLRTDVVRNNNYRIYHSD
jgi:hypothetical protein